MAALRLQTDGSTTQLIEDEVPCDIHYFAALQRRCDNQGRANRPSPEASTNLGRWAFGKELPGGILAVHFDRHLLRGIPFFERLDEVALSEALKLASSRRFPAGKAVFEQGAAATHFFVLLSGRLKVTQVTPQGQQIVVRMVNPGDLFGIAKALHREDYPGTATAVIESVALAWPMTAWADLVDRNAAIAGNVLQTIGDRLQEAHARIREISTEEAERRVGHAVLRLANQSGRKEPEGIRIDFPVSKQDIAEMTGTTLYTVSRILSAWQEARIIDGGRQKLLLRNPHRLLMIADGREPGLLK
jgi:CRP-like cAMP-binding protein